MQFLKDFKHIRSHFGFLAACKLVVIPRVAYHIGVKKNLYIPALLKWQRKLVRPIIEEYKTVSLTSNNIHLDYTIWTCWWQGEENMPEVIKECHKSLIRNANGHRVILITNDNFKNFIDLPDWLLEKLQNKQISYSHFSDIIRLSLLKKYGGRWVDAALFLTRPHNFFGNFYMPKLSKRNDSICQGKWWFGIIYASPEHKLINFILDCLLIYWEKFNSTIDYLMFDGFLRIAYEEFKDIHELIDSLEVSSPNIHDSRYSFCEEVNFKNLQNLIDNNEYLSLTWRINYTKRLENGKQTYYGALLDYFPNN